LKFKNKIYITKVNKWWVVYSLVIRFLSAYRTLGISKAMVTNHLRAPYGVYFTKNRTILRRPYGARPAAGRIVRLFINILDIVRCPVNFRYYLKFHGARSAFGRAIKGKITSAGHRTVPRRRPVGVCTHRTDTGRLFNIYIVRFQRRTGRKYIFGLSSWGWLTCNEQVLLNIFAVLSKCVFHHLHCQSQPQSFLFKQTVSLEVWRRILIYIYTSLHVKICVKSAGHRTVSGWSLTTPIGHRKTSFGARPGIGWCFHIQTPSGARTICDHAR